MEELEISSWLTLDALKKKAEIIETVGNLQSSHSMSVFCQIEDDYLELVYTDTSTNCLRRYEDKDEFEAGLEQRKEEDGESPYEEGEEFDEDDDDDDDDDAAEALDADDKADDY